jgi:hypothetical protein
VTKNSAPSKDLVDVVYSVSPVGNITKGTTISLTVYGDAVAPPAPTSTPSATPKAVAPNATFVVSWGAYSCPSGTNLSSYDIDPGGATVAIQPGTNPAATLIAPATAETLSISYKVTCTATGASSGLQSDSSPALELVMTAAPTTPTATPTTPAPTPKG